MCLKALPKSRNTGRVDFSDMQYAHPLADQMAQCVKELAIRTVGPTRLEPTAASYPSSDVWLYGYTCVCMCIYVRMSEHTKYM